MTDLKIVDSKPKEKSYKALKKHKEQADWLKWRREGIGASDVPCILNYSNYRSKNAIFAEKTLISHPTIVSMPNYIQSKGNGVEFIAREYMEKEELSFDIPETLVERLDKPWAKASLDGLNEKEKYLWECKLVGKEKFKRAKEGGEIQRSFFVQTQWQMYVLDYDVCHLTFVMDQEAKARQGKPVRFICHTIEVKRNDEAQEILKMQMDKFWGEVTDRKRIISEKA